MRTSLSLIAIAIIVSLPAASQTQRVKIERASQARAATVEAPSSGSALDAARTSSLRAPPPNQPTSSSTARSLSPAATSARMASPANPAAVRRRIGTGGSSSSTTINQFNSTTNNSEFVTIETFTAALSLKADAAALASTQQTMQNALLDIFEKQESIEARLDNCVLKSDLNETTSYLEQQIMYSAGVAGAPGLNGRELELRATQTSIQWRHIGDGESAWRDLMYIAELKGDQGEPGETVVLAEDQDLADFPEDAKTGTWVLGVRKTKTGQMVRTWVRITGQDQDEL